ncbi:hypothetical protein QEJ31_14685 [Pigmentibacter sp. JX0631]|uniref:hypothetical protein n=1 Tax=Pigmentibacter sp. JX0631 TaxID=2976982 RepID=UPI002468848A|nr:hypothetical protein [Pigmentibacter sp. JX0631]WGL59776.1 hypothetical protein QEJ31_14685 [Pigmentibacter sp. JX0631]
MSGVILGICITAVSYVAISKLIKKNESSVRSYLNSTAEKLRDYLENFITEKRQNESKQSQEGESASEIGNKKNKLFQN